MIKIDECYDEILAVNYELHKIKLSELKLLVKSWYKGIKFEEFNMEKGTSYRDDKHHVIGKKSGLICNYFFAYREGDEYYLMDGFNRLLTEYGKVEEDTIVYIKIITDKLADNKLMSIMFNLNLWKINARYHEFSTIDFLDRGFRLFIYKKFGIKLYASDKHQTRTRDEDDYRVLENYFTRESYDCGLWKHSYNDIYKIFNNEMIVEDLREIVKSNDYLEREFKNYDRYLDGFIYFLARRRIIGDVTPYKFDDFLNKLYDDKKFFNKLKKMSWTDSTRKNVFKFFQQFEQEIETFK